jgi:hypothetical protein
MRGYSELKIFTGEELGLWHDATKVVDALREAEFPDLRCHELARAVGKVLGLQVQDGFYGFVDHSWLWLRPLGPTIGRIGFPNILDVYCVGSLPLVRLVDAQATSLPARRVGVPARQRARGRRGSRRGPPGGADGGGGA